MSEASPKAEAELRCDEANRSEQPSTEAQWELQVMKPTGAIAQAGEVGNPESTTLWSRDETTLLKDGEDSG